VIEVTDDTAQEAEATSALAPRHVLRAALRASLLGGGLGVLGLLSGEPLQAWFVFTLAVVALGPAALFEAAAVRRRRSLGAVLGLASLTLGVSWAGLAGALLQTSYLAARWGKSLGVQDAWLGGQAAWEDLAPFVLFSLALSAALVLRVLWALRAEGTGASSPHARHLGLASLALLGALVLAASLAAGRGAAPGVAVVLLGGCLPAAGALAAYYLLIDRLAERLEAWREEGR
jgi:hypothetical protein